MHLPAGLRPDRDQTRSHLRRSRRPASEEYRAPGARVPHSIDGAKSRRGLLRKVPYRKIGVLSALLLLGLAVVTGWQFWSSEPPNVKSSIAVLPFTNIDGEESTGRLADGIT